MYIYLAVFSKKVGYRCDNIWWIVDMEEKYKRPKYSPLWPEPTLIGYDCSPSTSTHWSLYFKILIFTLIFGLCMPKYWSSPKALLWGTVWNSIWRWVQHHLELTSGACLYWNKREGIPTKWCYMSVIFNEELYNHPRHRPELPTSRCWINLLLYSEHWTVNLLNY